MLFLRYNLFTLLWFGIVLLLTLTPGGGGDHLGVRFIDKLVHFGLFTVLTLLMVVGFKKQNSLLSLHSYSIIWALGLTVLIGCSIELLQTFIPGRDFDLLDILFNTFGTFIGVFMYYLLYKL